jgi:formyltetrahydrofolate deformylase
MSRKFLLTLSCPQRPGIVHAVTAFLFGHGCDIVEHQQFDDPIRGALFLRTEVVAAVDVDAEELSSAFRTEVAEEFGMSFTLSDDSPQRVLVMVSKMGHCLNDLIFRWRAGSLNADLVAVVSNHEDLRPMAEAAGLPFYHVSSCSGEPSTSTTRSCPDSRGPSPTTRPTTEASSSSEPLLTT